jgi:4a-hydroxytetrahydrobiopterin dehydratase
MEKLTEDQVHERLEDVTGWDYENGVLHTSFEFEDFKDAFSVMTRIAFEAEAMQHHPDWHNVYNTLNISLTTHDAGGVTDKDFDMIKRIEYIVGDE